MNVEGLVEAASAGVGAAVVAGESYRRYWTRREARQQIAFKTAVRQVVNEALTDILNRQTEMERRQGQHLDRQDTAIKRLHDRMTALERKR